jgi:hypothetical protein
MLLSMAVVFVSIHQHGLENEGVLSKTLVEKCCTAHVYIWEDMSLGIKKIATWFGICLLPAAMNSELSMPLYSQHELQFLSVCMPCGLKACLKLNHRARKFQKRNLGINA